MSRIVRGIVATGVRRSWWQLYYTGDVKVGTFVGTDAFGNKYYESNAEVLGTQAFSRRETDPNSLAI